MTDTVADVRISYVERLQFDVRTNGEAEKDKIFGKSIEQKSFLSLQLMLGTLDIQHATT